MTVEATFDAGQCPLSALEELYRSPAKRIAINRHPGVERSAAAVDRAAAGKEPVYGINTGFGKLAHTRIEANDTAELQRNLVLSHCCGVGEKTPSSIVRLMLALKLNSLARGASGVRPIILDQLESLLEHDLMPVIPAQGSVGASGDLAPLAHMAAVMIGESDVWYQGDAMPTPAAMQKLAIEPCRLGAKEGLALINGTQFSTSWALAGLFEARCLALSSLVTGAMATDAAMGSGAPFRPGIHELRGHAGQIEAARALRALMQGSEIRESHRSDDDRVQDPYCIRCQPQVMGACLDLLDHATNTLHIEANAVTDNPLVLRDGSIVSGGNFHGEPVAFAADQIALAIAEIGSITQRRIAMLVDPALNFGLPAFLSPSPGLNSGFMIAEVTTAALMSENKHLANPCSVDSTPTSANQEDHVSMAAHASCRLMRMVENLAKIVAVEWLVATQGIEFREPLKTSPNLQGAMDILRTKVPKLENDRYMANDIETTAALVRSGALLDTVTISMASSN